MSQVSRSTRACEADSDLVRKAHTWRPTVRRVKNVTKEANRPGSRKFRSGSQEVSRAAEAWVNRQATRNAHAAQKRTHPLSLLVELTGPADGIVCSRLGHKPEPELAERLPCGVTLPFCRMEGATWAPLRPPQRCCRAVSRWERSAGSARHRATRESVHTTHGRQQERPSRLPAQGQVQERQAKQHQARGSVGKCVPLSTELSV